MLLVHNERNTKTVLRQWAEVGPQALEDSKVCNTTKTLVTYALLYRISLFSYLPVSCRATVFEYDFLG